MWRRLSVHVIVDFLFSEIFTVQLALLTWFISVTCYLFDRFYYTASALFATCLTIFSAERYKWFVIFPSFTFDMLSLSSEALCRNVFRKIHANTNHPLRALFQPRKPSARNTCTLKAPLARTSRFHKSFIRFSRWLDLSLVFLRVFKWLSHCVIRLSSCVFYYFDLFFLIEVNVIATCQCLHRNCEAIKNFWFLTKLAKK